ncbi:DinB family protein [Filibacter tadaridae]|uniref:DinB superfamily protein n=1 Tax=Filibacter tadaridae TaxID=2483811 RepID=A0A3P5WC44_9BACL|nr:DinB family protein [Filibacter tadaridae]VDC21043.1 DinB superfamily protein [Filibacter tadaridae]
MIIIETLNQLNFARAYTFSRLEKSLESAWDTQPNGFNNTIRWNAGHIFVSMETFVQKAVSGFEAVNPGWIPLFTTGSSPEGWTWEAPSNEEILKALQEQPARIVEALGGKLSNSLDEPMAIGKMIALETVESIIQFAVWHEGFHAGIIDSLNRVVEK